MDEGEGRKICDGEGIRIPEGWRQRLEGRDKGRQGEVDASLI